MSGRFRPVAGAVVAVLGIILLGAASLLGAPGSCEPRPPVRADDPGPSAERAPGLSASVPRRPGGPAASASPDAEPPAPAALGEPLPPQWPEFRPTRIELLPGTGRLAAPVDVVDVVDGSLELPDDADRVGWWRGGSLAGSPFGTVVVAGHLDSVTDPAGYLAGLAGLTRGDVVELATSQERQRYRVVGNYLLPSADLSTRSDLFEQRRQHRLLLITCGGPYDEVRGRYRDNRVVEAVPVVP